MQAITLDSTAKRVLRALFELAELECPASAGVIGRAIDMRAADVGRVLLVLDARGLAVAERARLTMRGLALAVRLPSLRLSEQPDRIARPALARVTDKSVGAQQKRA